MVSKHKGSVVKTVYLAMIHFDEVVHAPILGFTRFIYLYVLGENDLMAEDRIRGYLKRKYNLSPIKVKLTRALNQNPDKYIQLIK